MSAVLYDIDFQKWTAETAELLREGKFESVDLQHLVEEIEDLGLSDYRSAQSQLHRMLLHLVKQKIQPERNGASWRGSILHARREILLSLRHSPSLRRRLSAYLPEAYRDAIEDARRETGKGQRAVDAAISSECPFTLAQLLDAAPDALGF